MIDFEELWQALPNPSFLVAGDGIVRATNSAAEDFLAVSTRNLTGKSLFAMAGEDSRLADLIRRVARQRVALGEYTIEFNWPDAPPRMADIFAAPSGENDVLITIHPRANAERMGRQLTSRDAARSIVGMASMLAHEIKNPLAGIQGAAQLLEMSASDEDRELTELIREEVVRIGKLVQRVEAFGDIGIARRRQVNIHDVLDRAANPQRQVSRRMFGLSKSTTPHYRQRQAILTN